jgi:hypothetical protein
VRRRITVFVLSLALVPAAAASAQQQMPNLREMSGVPLPVPDVPPGTVTVRVIRGDFDKPIAGQPVEFTIDGKVRVEKTNAAGRAEVRGLEPGAKLTAATTVDGERLVSQEITVAGSGIRVALVATDPEAARRAEEDQRLAAGPAVAGTVVFSPQSRVIAEFNNDRLNVFYMIEILNTARTPVDIGKPILLDLPREARGAGLMQGSTKQATVSGSRVTVLGPFAPGVTPVQLGYELPFSGDTARLRQVWPVPLQAMNLVVGQTGAMEFRSAQVTEREELPGQQPAIAARGPALAAGQALELEITGLPHHTAWPRNLALGLAGVIVVIGIWAAAFPSRRRRAA